MIWHFAIGAAVLYALSTPFSKLLMQAGADSTILAGLLYLGAGALVVGLFMGASLPNWALILAALVLMLVGSYFALPEKTDA